MTRPPISRPVGRKAASPNGRRARWPAPPEGQPAEPAKRPARQPFKPKPGAAEQRRMARLMAALRAELLARVGKLDRDERNATRRQARRARREGGKIG